MRSGGGHERSLSTHGTPSSAPGSPRSAPGSPTRWWTADCTTALRALRNAHRGGREADEVAALRAYRGVVQRASRVPPRARGLPSGPEAAALGAWRGVTR